MFISVTVSHNVTTRKAVQLKFDVTIWNILNKLINVDGKKSKKLFICLFILHAFDYCIGRNIIILYSKNAIDSAYLR